jgi:penicillin-binding protein 2
VRNIYSALYGVKGDGSIDARKALLPEPQKGLPKVRTDGTIAAPKITGDPAKDTETAQKDNPTNGDDQQPAGTTPSPTTGNRDTRRRRGHRARGSRRRSA